MVAWVALATVLLVAPAQTTSGAPASASSTTRVEGDSHALLAARTRIAWDAALDAAGWDRDALSVRAAADTLTAALLDRTSQDLADAPLRSLLAEMSGEPLGPYLHAHPSAEPTLIAAWLSRHDDPPLLAMLPPRVALTMIATSSRTPPASVLMAALVPGGPPGDRALVCRGALRLAPPARHVIATTVATEALETMEPECVLLVATLPGRRTAFEHALAHWVSGQDPARVPHPTVAALAFVLSLDGPNESVRRYVAAAARNSGFLYPAVPRLPDIAPLFPGTIATPGVRALVSGLSHVVELRTFGWLRLRVEDPTLVDDALRSLPPEGPYVDQGQRNLAAGLAVLATPPDPAASRRTRERLASIIRTASAPEPGDTVASRWRQALDDVEHCGSNTSCLQGLLGSGPERSAARAAMVLGSRGMSDLPPAIGRALIERLMLTPDPWLLTAVLTRLRGCPRWARGLREARSTALPTELMPYLQALETACASH